MHPKFRYSRMNLRFELSAEGRKAFPRLRGGRITGESRDKRCWIVLVDDNKYPYALGKSFVRVMTGAPTEEAGGQR
jgi:hypothetical protein